MTSPSRHRPQSSRAARAGRKQTRKGCPAASEGSGFSRIFRTSVPGQELGGSTERGSPARGLAHVLFHSLGSSPSQPSATGTREIPASRGGLPPSLRLLSDQKHGAALTAGARTGSPSTSDPSPADPEPPLPAAVERQASRDFRGCPREYSHPLDEGLAADWQKRRGRARYRPLSPAHLACSHAFALPLANSRVVSEAGGRRRRGGEAGLRLCRAEASLGRFRPGLGGQCLLWGIFSGRRGRSSQRLIGDYR